MRNKDKVIHWFHRDKGSVLLMVAGGMVMILAVSAFAIDLANFYLARAQAQRAADAAALAGATAFVNSSCISTGCTPLGPQETMGRQQAEAAGDQNYIAGQSVNIQGTDVTFNYPSAFEPQITVVAGATVPTFFAKKFGMTSTKVSASATAEAYTPGGGGPAGLTASCVRPFLVPNCDPGNPKNTANPSCSAIGGGTYFINPDGSIPSNVIGESWQLHTDSGPSQWYLVGFLGAPPSSGSALEDHITMCTPAALSCGSQLYTANGKMVGKVDQGVNTLINASGDGLNKGQDTISVTPGSPASFTVYAGSNNPYQMAAGTPYTNMLQSDSVITVPVYSGVDVNNQPLAAGGSNVTVLGYMQLFVKDYVHSGKSDYIDTVILNVTTCGGSNNNGVGPSPSVAAPPGSPVPIRLIRTS